MPSTTTRATRVAAEGLSLRICRTRWANSAAASGDHRSFILRMEDPLNAGHHVVVLDELPALQLRQAFLDLRSEPRVMVAVGFLQLLHQLLRVASGLRCKAVELVLEFRREVDFH